MKKHIFYWLLLGLVVITGCQKELSFELGNTPGQGSLQADVTGDCLPKTVNGIYVATTPLVPATNTITIQVNVVRTGTYIITTDTVNGYYFRATGTFTALGATNVTLRSNGTPFAAGIDNFVVSYNGTVCDIQVTVLPAGSGPAIFTLIGAPGSCGTPTINGTYAKSVPLNASNTVRLNVNVTTAGSYDITTTAVNGITFAGTGTLATGAQTITLTGSGTPGAAGNTTIPVTVGTSTCSFVINVIDLVTGTLGGGGGACTPVTINGNYYKDIPLTASNTVQVQITTSTVGPYFVSTNTVAGFSFSGSGTSTGATQTITLTGTGTPNATGPQNFTVTFGTSSCSFSITVNPGGVFTADCSSAVVNGTYPVGVILNASNTVDIDINVTSLGPYNIVTTLTNGMTFSASGTFTILGGPQTITLAGSGTPTAQGTFNIPMPGTTPCTFPVIVSGPPGILTCKINGVFTAFNNFAEASYFFPPPNNDILMGGFATGGEEFNLEIDRLNGANITTGTYTVNGLLSGFYAIGADYTDLTPVHWTATTDFLGGTQNPAFTIIITSITATRIIGTFSGPLKENFGSGPGTKTITEGVFNLPIN
jgi:hypothetical protein